MKIDSAFVAAILTILGYSINDTIVVFDRIRENNHLLRRKENLFNISNISINQTLSRTIITGLSAMITLLCVYIFGGMTTKDFVLILLIGFIFGTYSSIMIASPVVVWFKGKE
jgi:preprotein translocase SecF subunit